MPELQQYLQEIRELHCAPLLSLMAIQIKELGREVETHVGSFGVRFSVNGETLCELSVFGELFRARIGRNQSLEYRVRDESVALQALDHIVREYVLLRNSSPGSVCGS